MKIAIIGGGITGLTTALAFTKIGIQTTVYEQASSLSEIGAGILLQPNAVKVLQWLGISEKIQKAGVVLNKLELSLPDLTPIKKLKQRIIHDEWGNQIVGIHRGRLQKGLLEAASEGCEVRLGWAYQSHRQKEGKIEITFEGGKRAEADVVLGADGIRSKVRQQIFPDSSLRNSGQICWRGIANLELPTYLANQAKEAWGKGVRFGLAPVSPNEVYWFAVANDSAKMQTLPKASIGQLFSNFAPLVKDLIAHTEQSAIHTAVLFDLKRLSTWHQGAVCLVGDAAHATTPNMGQGACQGIEDAYFLSQIFKNAPSTTAAFEAFEAKRRKKVDYVVNNSWAVGRVAHHVLMQPLAKLAMKLTPETVMIQQLKQLYKIENLD